MKIRNVILFFLFLVFLGGGFFLFCTIFGVDPATANPIQFSIFFSSLFVFLFGLFSLLNIRLKENQKGEVGNVGLIKIGVRQALWIAGFCTGLVFLKIFGFLTWWTALVLFLIFLLLEIYFRAK